MLLILLAAALLQDGRPPSRNDKPPTLTGEAATREIEREFIAAENERRPGDEPERVLDCTQAFNTLEMNACVQIDLEKEIERMDSYLEAARLRAEASDASEPIFGQPTRQAAYLLESQSAWEIYAKVVCDGVYDQWKDGTIRTVMALDCRIRMTRERTHVVWRDYLTYADTTPPVLPEPTEPASATSGLDKSQP